MLAPAMPEIGQKALVFDSSTVPLQHVSQTLCRVTQVWQLARKTLYRCAAMHALEQLSKQACRLSCLAMLFGGDGQLS